MYEDLIDLFFWIDKNKRKTIPDDGDTPINSAAEAISWENHIRLDNLARGIQTRNKESFLGTLLLASGRN